MVERIDSELEKNISYWKWKVCPFDQGAQGKKKSRTKNSEENRIMSMYKFLGYHVSNDRLDAVPLKKLILLPFYRAKRGHFELLYSSLKMSQNPLC